MPLVCRLVSLLRVRRAFLGVDGSVVRASSGQLGDGEEATVNPDVGQRVEVVEEMNEVHRRMCLVM